MTDTLPALMTVAIFVAYVALVAALWKANRVDYPRIADSSRTLTRGIIIPIGLGLFGLGVATTVLGWWPDVLTQEPTGPAWAVVVPLLWLVVGVVTVARADLRGLGARRVVILAAAALVVGAAEELLARGILVVGAQQAGWSLAAVWMFSTSLFAILHAINGLFGLTWKATIGQLGASFVGGTALFVTLIATGSMILGALGRASRCPRGCGT
ncbi:CPBP family glutamic-type intramembrane protease [Microbacter sp. GSS18]|nr:CPBP family glutamic-type intramembrane protease [Microbacter sp. GSS18]